MATSLANYRNDLLKKAATRIVGSSVYITTGAATVFTVPKNSTSTVPGEIALTAMTTKYTAPAYKWYKKLPEDSTFTLISGATTSAYAAIGDSVFLQSVGSSAAIQYKVEVTETSGPTANPSDFTITIPILREGVNSVVGYLTNDTLNVPADSQGVVPSGIYSSLKSTYIIYNGTSDDSANWTVSISTSVGITAVLESGKTVAVTNISNTFASGYVEVTASRQGYSNVVKRINVTKVSAGVTPVIYSVEPEFTTIVKNANGTYTPSSLVINAYSQTGSTKTAYSGMLKIYKNNETAASYTSSVNESTKSYILSGSITSIKLELYKSITDAVLLDAQTIPVSEAGSSTVSIIVANNNYSIPSLSTGAVASYEESGTTITVREGNSPLTYRTTLGTNTSSFTVGVPTISVTNGIVVGAVSDASNGTTTATILKHSAMLNTINTITITYPITYVRANGGQATEYVTQTITKTVGGVRGSRTLYATDAAYTSTYDYDGAGTTAAGAASYAKKATDLINAATVGSSPRTPIEGDTVTFSNGSTASGYVYTITYKADTSSWTPPGTIIDGSLLVTGSVTASKINSNGLEIRDGSGALILGAGKEVDWSKLGGANKNLTNLGYLGDLNATRNVNLGSWVTGSAYTVGDIVNKDGSSWSCISAHTSSTSNAPPALPTVINTWWSINAQKGDTGVSVSTIVEKYQAGNSGTTAPTGTWATTIPSLTDTNRYLWSQETITFSDSSTTTRTKLIGTKGVDGSDGKGISSVANTYQVGSSGTTAPTGTWTTTIPSLTDTNKYLWNKEVITYTDSTTSTQYYLMAQKGDPGPKGESAAINYASSELWNYTTSNVNAPAPLGGEFVVAGDANDRIWGENPFGQPTLLWLSYGNDATSDAEGGWNKTIEGLTANKSYISFVYFRRNSSTTDGSFYHGCGTSSTLNLDGTVNTNPYFTSSNIGSFEQGVWYVSVGVIHGNNSIVTVDSDISGIYKYSTGQQVMQGTDFKMAAGATTQTHRTYLYYSTTSTARLEWWSPGFYEINGNEPKLQQIVSMSGMQVVESSAAYTASNGWSINRDGSFTAAGGGNVVAVAEDKALINFKKPDNTAAFAVDQTGTAVFGGALLGATGTFSGTLSAGVVDSGSFDSIAYNYTSAGTFTLTIPAKKAGWASMNLRAVVVGAGGGGGGGFNSTAPKADHTSSGGGGGAGTKTIYNISNVAAGTDVTITVGAGGTGGAGSTAWSGTYSALSGNSGAASSIKIGTTTYSSAGGAGGGGGSRTLAEAYMYSGSATGGGAGGSLGGTPGAGGFATRVNGGAGGTSEFGTGGVGGAAAANSASAGGTGGIGSGGGGGAAANGNYVGAGGAGGRGAVYLEFYDPNLVVRQAELQALQDTLDLWHKANGINSAAYVQEGTGNIVSDYKIRRVAVAGQNYGKIELYRTFTNCNCACDCTS